MSGTTNDTADRFDMAEVAQQILQRGYAILDAVVPEALVDEILSEVDRLRHSDEDYLKIAKVTEFRGSATHSIRNLISRGSVFQRVATFEPLQPLLEQLLGAAFLLYASAIVEVWPNEVPQRLHADDVLIRLPRPFPQPLVVQSIWALSRFTADNGATRIVPGSHVSEGGPTSEAPDRTIAVEMKKGSILVYHGSLWHGTGPNTCLEEKRVGMSIAYCASFIRPYENQLKLISRDEAAQMPPLLRRLIGYDYAVPAGMRR